MREVMCRLFWLAANVVLYQMIVFYDCLVNGNFQPFSIPNLKKLGWWKNYVYRFANTTFLTCYQPFSKPLAQ